MTFAESGQGNCESDVQRPESDDYDLLTFGEVAARLSEELSAETAELDRLRRETRSDPNLLRRHEERIALLKTVANRYREEQQTNDNFSRRFGSLRGAGGDRPQWR
ncbi:hypothetical protein [Mycobacterium mantenii]|uniref:Acyl-CoA synthase n=1 Tax=Mycobacterium mantenii TaxID=560555 RepID=A0A1A2TPT9_MYCNT|nr:hypothetical protein [Mycobacterium mantenii]OBH44200.1 hypothetical protein A5688_11690 [Mycobacterium mantenii]OBH78047.1 hypothetical protein A5683_17500 [Mycobacterium mantenii]